MQKEKKTVAISFLIITTIFGLILISQTFHSTGFAIFQSQPNSTTGQDTYIREGSSVNFGELKTIRIGKTLAGIEFKSLIKFNVSSIPQKDTIANAAITLHISSSTATQNITVTAYRITSNWSESGTTWFNDTPISTWNNEGGDYLEEIGSKTITNETNFLNIAITDAVRNWINGTYENYGVLLLSPDGENGNYTDFDSSDSSTEQYRPTLTIEHAGNIAPIISNFETNSSSGNPTQTGQAVLFNTTWFDYEGDNARIFICNSTLINLSGCSQKTFCSTSYSPLNPVTCEYQAEESDNRTTTFYYSICDNQNCSTVNNSEFYVNHNPSIILEQPNGGETLNQSKGNYSIKFNVSDKDNDSLNVTLYYGLTQNSTSNKIATLNPLSSYCTDKDSKTSTENNCTYSWNTGGIYGTYYVTATINDSFTGTNDSSDSDFDIKSIIDNQPPEITNPEIDSSIWEGKTAQISATINDENMDSAWVVFNYSSTNITMTNLSGTTFAANFTAPANGTYTYTIYARDIIGNTGNNPPQEFTVYTPNATSLNQTAPSIALPFHTIRITGNLHANNSLTNVHAYLNAPQGFGFISDYPQNTQIGNMPSDSTSTAIWYVSVPITEDTYNLNITYTDGYSNSWNSENMEIEVTSAIGGYEVEVSGYPEVETSNDYYVESKFKQNGVVTSPDSMKIKIYDASGNLVVGPASMAQKSTGEYNYSYTVGASATEGLWETRINATKSSTSYYANEFWKVVGGPFDVRDIKIEDSSTNNLTISFTAENTGGANKDLSIVWNLTKEPSEEMLDNGGETFMVPANSEKNWTISPNTNYVGQVKITIIGYYSQGEKAGAYKVFSTTEGTNKTPSESPSGGSGGGSRSAPAKQEKTNTTKNPSIEITGLENIDLAKNLEKIITIEIKNNGDTDLTDINLFFSNLEKEYYSFSPEKISEIKVGETKSINLMFIIPDLIGEKDATLIINSKEKKFTKKFKIKILSMRDFFLKEIERLSNRVTTTKEKINAEGLTNLIENINVCDNEIDNLKNEVDKENYIDAKLDIEKIDKCINRVEKEIKPKQTESPSLLFWIIIATLIGILLAIIIIGIIVYKKLDVFKFITQKETTPAKTENSTNQRESINEQIKKIKQELEK